MSVRETVEYGVIGGGATCLFSFCIAFFPAVVFGVQVNEWLWGSMAKEVSYVWGIGATIVGAIVISILIVRALVTKNPKLWIFIVSLYLFTLWPFIQFVMWSGSDDRYAEANSATGYAAIPFPGFDWIPFIF